MSKQYQLVIQWDERIGDFELLIDIEDVLIDSLSPCHDVDGHDMGSGEMNIFIITADPVLAFNEIKDNLAGKLSLEDVRVAYRDLEEETFIVLWPLGLKEFDIA